VGESHAKQDESTSQIVRCPAAHNPAFAKKAGVPQKVAREFNRADKGTGILKGRRKGK
jgi:hypothetical protein